MALGLHGRPTLSTWQLIEMAAVLAFVVWGAGRVVRNPGFLTYYAIGFVAIWQSANLTPTLLNGFVLMALPATLCRVAAVLCIRCGVALLLLGLPGGEESRRAARAKEGKVGAGQDGLAQSLV